MRSKRRAGKGAALHVCKTLGHMHDRRRLALDALRMRGGLTINELARELRITRTAAATRMARLLADGLVHSTGLQATGRRPGVVYGLTSEADLDFHSEYDTFAVDLLEETAKVSGERALDRILRRVGERWVARDAPAVEKLRGNVRLAGAMQRIAARGFMPSVGGGERSRVLRLHHCAIGNVCRSRHKAADMVQHWVAALIGEPINRTGCIYEGAQACEFRLGARSRTPRRSSVS